MKAMKFWLLMAVMVVAIAAHARKNDDPEMRHVRLTMMDGKQIEGYIPKKYMGWGARISSKTCRESRWQKSQEVRC